MLQPSGTVALSAALACRVAPRPLRGTLPCFDAESRRAQLLREGGGGAHAPRVPSLVQPKLDRHDAANFFWPSCGSCWRRRAGQSSGGRTCSRRSAGADEETVGKPICRPVEGAGTGSGRRPSSTCCCGAGRSATARFVYADADTNGTVQLDARGPPARKRLAPWDVMVHEQPRCEFQWTKGDLFDAFGVDFCATRTTG